MKKHLLICASILLSVSCASVDEDSDALPERYSQLGLESLEQVFDFEFQRFRDADRQSVIVRTRGREAYLLVFNAPGFYRNDSVDIGERNLRPGLTRVCVTRGVDGICRRLEVIYKFEDKKQENEAVRFLRAND